MPIAFILILAIFGAYLITKEYRKKDNAGQDAVVQTEEVVSLDELKTSDTVVVLGKDETSKKLKVRHLGSTEDYELTYDGSVSFLNRFGTAISVSEIANGEILDVVYSKHSGKVNSVQVSTQTWTMTGMNDFVIDNNRKIITIMGKAYQYGADLVLYSDAEPVRLMDITDMDTLTIKGYNRKVCSISVEKGHGYLRVENDAYFIGGWIEVGQKIIRPITEEMLLAVPEGRYKVRVTNRGYAGEDQVLIRRDEETKLDLSKIEVEEVAIGHVQFSLQPEYAQLYIDGEITDYDERVPLEYGVHEIKVTAAGYETVETKVKVTNDYANIEIALDPLPEEEEEDEEKGEETTPSKMPPTVLTENTESEETSPTPTPAVTPDTDPSPDGAETTISDTKKIYVQAPSDVEVYLDGNYIGVSPISTGKVTGSHTITLSKSGYITKSYTIYVENDKNDVNLSFSDLLEE